MLMHSLTRSLSHPTTAISPRHADTLAHHLPPSPFQIKDEYVPGELGFDPLNLTADLDADALYELKTKEINNGRLAMIAWAGFAVQVCGWEMQG